MKFRISRTSDWDDHHEEREFQTLEELMKFIEEVKYPVIVHYRRMVLEIYDDYRE